MDEFELVADEFTPPRGDCPRFLVCLFEIGITNYELGQSRGRQLSRIPPQLNGAQSRKNPREVIYEFCYDRSGFARRLGAI